MPSLSLSVRLLGPVSPHAAQSVMKPGRAAWPQTRVASVLLKPAAYIRPPGVVIHSPWKSINNRCFTRAEMCLGEKGGLDLLWTQLSCVLSDVLRVGVKKEKEIPFMFLKAKIQPD